MDLTTTEREAVSDLLAQIRQIGEDFTHEYVGRTMVMAPKNRLLFMMSRDTGETLLSAFADTVSLLDDPEKLSKALTFLGQESPPLAEIHRWAKEFDLGVECFNWAARRCLGEAFTPPAQSGHRKLALIRRAAIMSGLMQAIWPRSEPAPQRPA